MMVFYKIYFFDYKSLDLMLFLVKLSILMEKNRLPKLDVSTARGKSSPAAWKTSSRDSSSSPPKEDVTYEAAMLKLQCHEALLEECRKIALEREILLSSVMNLTAVNSMSELLPSNKEEFMKIQHVTQANYTKYGERLLAITQKYRMKVNELQPTTSHKSLDDFKSPYKRSGGTKRKKHVEGKQEEKR